ncbi:hypothetical protein B0H14DRAFT_3532856 [Mycena olivaceomarginata]|nr:hypothetical protein B0H14DRAFT_3532856 [Mycena olivaceomarginata]
MSRYPRLPFCMAIKRRLRATFNCSWLPAHRLQRLPLDQLHIPTVPHPQLPFWTMIKRYLVRSALFQPHPDAPRSIEHPRPPRNVLSANPPKNHTKLRSEVVQSLIWGLKHGSGNEKAVMHYGENSMSMAFYWSLQRRDARRRQWCGPDVMEMAGFGDVLLGKLPDAEYHALREKYQGFKRVKVEKGEVQEHHDGPRSSTLGKRRDTYPRNEVDHSTSHESTVPKGRGGDRASTCQEVPRQSRGTTFEEVELRRSATNLKPSR